MPLIDVLTFKAHLQEIASELQGAFLEKIIALDYHCFSLVFQVEKGKVAFFIDSIPQNSYILLTEEKFPLSKQPVNLAFSLEKYLANSKLANISQIGFDFVVKLDFTPTIESRQRASVSLIVELCAGKPNIILTDNTEQIIDLKTKVPSEKNRCRTLLPGNAYLPPPKPQLKNPYQITEAEWDSTIKENPYSLVWGIKEFIWSEINGSYEQLQSLLKLKNRSFYLYKIKDKFFISPLKLTPHTALGSYSTVNEALLDYYKQFYPLYMLEKQQKEQKQLLNAYQAKLIKRLRAVEKDLEKAKKALEYQRYGQLIYAHLAQAKIVGEQVEVPDYYQPDSPLIKIDIDIKKSLLENAQAFFAHSKRAKRSLELIERRITETQREIARVNQLLLEISEGKCLPPAVIKKYQRQIEIAPQFTSRAGKRENEKFENIYRFIKDEDYEFWVGKNQKGNEKLLKMTRGNEIWLHVQGYSGSHVVIKSNIKNQGIPPSLLLEAAEVAAYYSQAKKKEKVEVDYTRRKYVHKQKGKVGAVTYSQQKTLLVTPKNNFY